MQEMDAKRSTKLLQRENTEENDRADTLSDACQVGNTDGDVPVTQSTLTKSAEASGATQEAPLIIFIMLHVHKLPSCANRFVTLLVLRLACLSNG